MENKTDLRIWAKRLRKTLDMSEISMHVISQIRQLEIYKLSKHVMIFYPLNWEINLLPLLDDNKNFYLPRVAGNNLQVCPFKKDDRLKLSKLKIKEPLTDSVSAEVLDLVIVPALMADRNNFRLGYGGGFYDRFLKSIKVYSLAPIPKELVIDQLPADDFDVPVNKIITG